MFSTRFCTGSTPATLKCRYLPLQEDCRSTPSRNRVSTFSPLIIRKAVSKNSGSTMKLTPMSPSPVGRISW